MTAFPEALPDSDESGDPPEQRSHDPVRPAELSPDLAAEQPKIDDRTPVQAPTAGQGKESSPQGLLEQEDRRPSAESEASPLLAAFDALIALPPNVQRAVARAVEETVRLLDQDRFAVRLPGDPVPSQEEVASAAVRAAVGAEQARQAVEETSLDVEHVAEQLGATVADVRRAEHDGALVALHTADGPRFPTWQFDEAGTALPGLSDVTAEFPGSVVYLTGWVQGTNDLLGGETPRERLRRGDVEAVMRAVRALHG